MSKFDESTHKVEQEQEEHVLFQSFMNVCPAFADEEISEWTLAQCDPPDVICNMKSGLRLGIEICQWAHAREMSEGKARERNERKLLDAIGVPQPLNKSKNFWLAVFFPRGHMDITQAEYPMFRQSLARTIAHVDGAWSTQRQGPNNRSISLNTFPPLNKYFEQLKFVPGTALTSDLDWIVPAGHADSFDDRTMTTPLLEQIAKKKKQCRALKTDCDELYLLIAFDQALPYCSPIGTPHRRVGETAKEAAASLAADPGPFNRAFLFIAVEPGLRVYRLL